MRDDAKIVNLDAWEDGRAIGRNGEIRRKNWLGGEGVKKTGWEVQMG